MADSVIAAGLSESASNEELLAATLRRIPADLPGDTPAQRLALSWRAAHRMDEGAHVSELAELLLRAVAEGDDDVTLTLGRDVGDPVPLLILCGELDTAEALS